MFVKFQTVDETFQFKENLDFKPQSLLKQGTPTNWRAGQVNVKIKRTILN